MSNFVMLRFECVHCGELQLNNKNTDANVYTSWISGSGFLCEKCYTNNNFEGDYEFVNLKKYFHLMYNRPCCDKCNRQITTLNWLYCETCNYDYCARCDLKNCIKCNSILVKDKFNFTE